MSHLQLLHEYKAMFEDAVGELLAPTRCAGCDAYGTLMCDKCLKKLSEYLSQYACPRCGAPYGKIVCTECWDSDFSFTQTVVLGELSDTLARAVVLHKDSNEQRLGAYLGLMLGMRVRVEFDSWTDCVTWVAPSKKALQRRGFDHGKSLAEGVAGCLGVPAVGVVVRKQEYELRGHTRNERRELTSDTYSLSGQPIAPHMLLVDDVITTGATANSVANVLLEGGAREVRIAAVARTW
ncbi:MAG: ComF family protein [Coriobacteriia bacterium]|nr:ComF family protein [Coriobacteriia bacterium]